MSSVIKNIAVFIILSFAISCSKEFLNDNLTEDSLPMGVSNIYISPDWQSSAYMFKLSNVKEADYKIVSKPSWLIIESDNGHISDSIASIQCSAAKNSEFKKVGIFMDFMTVKADGKTYKVPVSYINEGNPQAQVQSSITLSYNYYGNPNLPIHNNGLGILIWEISSMPSWLAIDSTQLSSGGSYLSPYSTYNIPLSFKPGNAYGNLTGNIILLTNDKEHPRITINVSADLGTPLLNVSSNSINFSYSETTKSLSIGNYGNGRLIWEFKEKPEWLTITPTNGTCDSYNSQSVSFSCDRSKLSAGQNTATIILKSNDISNPSYNITVIAVAPGNNKNIHTLEGNITDAVLNKNTNILYYVTSTPNKFVAYDVVARTVVNEIDLSKAPTCFAISEDWTKAAVGHNGFMSAINLQTNTVSATYSLDYSVNDIAWAENDWFSYTQNGGSFSGLHWINTADGTLYDDADKYSLDGKAVVKKVPNQPYLIATRNLTSPSGFFAFDISAKSKKSYSHMDLYNFWFSEDGEYIFSRNLNVYRTTSSTGATSTFDADINAIGKINLGNTSYYGLQYIDHSTNYLWILQNTSYSSDESTILYQVEDNDYTLVKNIVYDVFFQSDSQTSPVTLNAHYVFANKTETELVVLCKGLTNNTWVIQFVPVK